MSNSLLAVPLTFGCSFSLLSPVTSAEYICEPLNPNMGNTAIVMTIIPKPPIQCVILRQSSKLLGKTSMSFRMVAPVVVNPDIVSKKASANHGMFPLSQYGISPMNENIIQVKVTITDPSRLPMDVEAPLHDIRAVRPNIADIPNEMPKYVTVCSE